jgi:hypothetical protein
MTRLSAPVCYNFLNMLGESHAAGHAVPMVRSHCSDYLL